ncbi:MAG: alpha/beta hydrolase [Sphingobium sp.]
MTFDLSRRRLLVTGAAGLLLPSMAWATEAVTATAQSVALKGPDGRVISAWHWRAKGRRLGTIVFSHGALSAPRKYALLIQPWVAAGYDVVAPLHVDSTDHPHRADFPGLTGWTARIEDMRAVSAYVGGRYIAAGHSYGGLTALTLGGCDAMVPAGVAAPLRDPNARVVLAFSPPPAIPVLMGPRGYSTLAVPALIQTGTADLPPGAPAGPDGWRAHLDAYEAAADGGDRYALVLDDVDHYFGGAICDPDKPGPARADQVARAVDVSLMFLRAYAGKSAPARKAIDARLGRSEGMTLYHK